MFLLVQTYLLNIKNFILLKSRWINFFCFADQFKNVLNLLRCIL